MKHLMDTVRKMPDLVMSALVTALEGTTERVRICPSCGFELVDPFAEPSPDGDDFGYGHDMDSAEFDEYECLNCGNGY